MKCIQWITENAIIMKKFVMKLKLSVANDRKNVRFQILNNTFDYGMDSNVFEPGVIQF